MRKRLWFLLFLWYQGYLAIYQSPVALDGYGHIVEMYLYTLPWTLPIKRVAQDEPSPIFTVVGILYCYGYVGLDVFLPIVFNFVLFTVRYYWEINCF